MTSPSKICTFNPWVEPVGLTLIHTSHTCARLSEACDTGAQPAALGGDDRWEAAVCRLTRCGRRGEKCGGLNHGDLSGNQIYVCIMMFFL